MIANVITVSRIALIPFIIILLLQGNSFWAFVLFLAGALTDLLDGYVARRMKLESDFGKTFDPLADKLLVIGILGTLLIMGEVSWIPVSIIFAREIAVSLFRAYKATQGKAFGARFLAKAKTVSQLLAVGILILKLPFADWVLWAAAILSVVSGVDYVRKL